MDDFDPFGQAEPTYTDDASPRCGVCERPLHLHVGRRACVAGTPTVVRSWWHLPMAGSAWREASLASP